MLATSGGICLGKGVGPVRSGGRSVSWSADWAAEIGKLGWRKGWIGAGSAEGLDRSWVSGRARSELGRRKGWIGDGSTEGLDQSWVGRRARSELGRRAGFMVDGLT